MIAGKAGSVYSRLEVESMLRSYLSLRHADQHHMAVSFADLAHALIALREAHPRPFHAVVEHGIKDRTYHEIAGDLEVSHVTVYRDWQAGLNHLQRLLAHERDY